MMLLSLFLLSISCLLQLQLYTAQLIPQDVHSDTSLNAPIANLISRLLSTQINNDDNPRNLQAFSSLNTIFDEITLILPDSNISNNGLDLTITSLQCSDIHIQDIQVGHTSLSDTTTRLAINIIGLEITCNFRWSYKWTIFNGSGTGKALLDSSSWASINLDFLSQDYNSYPPTDVDIDQCMSDVQIGDLEFDGDGLGFIASILNTFERLLRDRIEEELNDTVCEELRGLGGDGALGDVLVNISDRMEGYLDPLSENMLNPLFLESSMVDDDVPRDENGTSLYLNFLELEEYAGDWINSALDKLDSFLGGSGSHGELGINSFLRENFLTNGEFVLNPSDFMDSNVIFESHDMLTETSLSIESVVIRGLDTFTEMDLMNAIGNHTLRNSVKLKSLSLVVDMKAFMKASSLSSAVISAPNSKPIEEKFSVTIDLNDIDIDFSLLVALNTETLGNMQLGPLLNTQSIFQCLLAAAEQLAFSELTISVSDVVPPTLEGFLDAGIDKIVSKGAVALFDMYESVLLKAMPNFFHSVVRKKLNDFIKKSLRLLTVCEYEQAPMNGFIDFRDLLTSPKMSASTGGSGLSPYGDVVAWIWELVEDQLLSANENGLLALNDLLIKPLTRAQSGHEGLLTFNQTLLDLKIEQVRMDIWKAFADNLRLGISNLRLDGLDTFREPFHIFKPSNSLGHLLENQISLGTDNRSLDVTFQFDIEVGGVTSPLATHNVMDLQIGVPPIEILADFFVRVDETKFMTMPLKNMLNTDCWLSMMAQTEHSSISSHKRSPHAGLALHHFDALFDAFVAESDCVSCSNTALEDFNEIMAFLAESDFFANIKSKGMLILSELVESDWMVGVLDNKIQAAANRCTSDSSSDALVSQLDERNVRFQTSRQIVDGILYASMSVVQVIAVVIAQKHANLKVPQSLDVELEDAEDVNLIDLTNLTSIASWMDIALDEASVYLGSAQQNSDGNTVLGIVNILQRFLLDDSGLLTIPIVDQGFKAGGVVFSLYNVTLIGLDSFTSFDVFNATGPHTLGNKVKLGTLGVSVDMGLSVGEDNEFETITASLILKDVDLDLSFFLAIDQGVLGAMKLGSVMNTRNIFFCIISAIHAVGISEFIMNIGNIESFSMSGFMADATDNSIEQFTQAVFDKYKYMVLDAVPAFTSITVRPLLHGIFEVLIDMAKGGQCPDLEIHERNEVIDYRDLLLSPARSKELLGSGESPYGDLFRMLFNFIDEMAAKSNDSGLSTMNDVLVSRLTNNGNIHWPGDVFSRDMNIALNGLNAAISIAIKDVKLENLDTIGSPLRILQPVHGENSILNNTASIGVGTDPVRVAFALFVSGEGDEMQVHNELEFGLSLSNTNLLLQLLAKMNSSSLLNFPLRDITNINCWLATIVTPILDNYGIRSGNKTISFEHILIAVAEAQLDMTCISCSSPVLLDMSSFFESAEGVKDTTRVTNMLLEYGSNLLRGEYVQNAMDKFLNEASMKCPHSQSYSPNFNGIKYDNFKPVPTSDTSYGFLWAIISIVSVMIFLSVLITLSVRYINRRRHAHWVAQLSRPQLLQLANDEKREAFRQTDINLRMKALVLSNESIPLVLRYGMPVVILGNIALFLSGHLSLGGTVNISGHFAGQHFDIQGFFEFSMVNSTIEMWEAGAYSLAILIVIFSGLWPYTKQLILLALWLLPTSRVPSKRRGQILHWLDVLGKWSMVDVFVLLMSIASFKISIESPSHLEMLPTDLFQVHMMVVPLWGLYANMLAQIVSQISSHVIISYHRKTINAATLAQELEWGIEPSVDDNESSLILRKHHFKLDYEASTSYAAVRKEMSTILTIFLVVFALLVVLGCSMSSFSIETVGLLGLAIESMNEFKDAIVYYSVFDLANMIMDEARYLNTASNYIGLGTLSSLLVITVFLVPLAQAISLFIEWYSPMNKNQRRRNNVVNEILSAWQYMEVYVLSVVIAAWQLGGVSEYMINAYCEPLENMFNTLSFYGILKQSDAQCFRVNASVNTATYLLIAASIILCILNHFIMSASAQREQDVNTPFERRLHSDRWLREKPTISLDEDESAHQISDDKIAVSQVASRFTDIYPFATRRNNDSTSKDVDAVEIFDAVEKIETPVHVESANAFWDVLTDDNVADHITENTISL